MLECMMFTEEPFSLTLVPRACPHLRKAYSANQHLRTYLQSTHSIPDPLASSPGLGAFLLPFLADVASRKRSVGCWVNIFRGRLWAFHLKIDVDRRCYKAHLTFVSKISMDESEACWQNRGPYKKSVATIILLLPSLSTSLSLVCGQMHCFYPLTLSLSLSFHGDHRISLSPT